jgi:hypothetical protein
VISTGSDLHPVLAAGTHVVGDVGMAFVSVDVDVIVDPER